MDKWSGTGPNKRRPYHHQGISIKHPCFSHPTTLRVSPLLLIHTDKTAAKDESQWPKEGLTLAYGVWSFSLNAGNTCQVPWKRNRMLQCVDPSQNYQATEEWNVDMSDDMECTLVNASRSKTSTVRVFVCGAAGGFKLLVLCAGPARPTEPLSIYFPPLPLPTYNYDNAIIIVEVSRW